MHPVETNSAEIRAFKAGLLYFAGVFALGFAFGVMRTLLLLPWAGEMLAVLIELPFILVFSWMLCARAIVRLNVSRRMSDRTVMGITAIVCLLLAEFFLFQMIYGASPTNFFAKYETAAGILGLVGQVLFAVFPLAQLKSQ